MMLELLKQCLSIACTACENSWIILVQNNIRVRSRQFFLVSLLLRRSSILKRRNASKVVFQGAIQFFEDWKTSVVIVNV